MQKSGDTLDSTGQRNTLRQDIGRRSIVEGFSAAGVEFAGDGVEIVLAEMGEIHPLGKILAQEAVGVFIAAALPGAVRIAEIDLHIGGHGEAGMGGQLRAPVPGQRAHLARPGCDHILAGLGADTINWGHTQFV